MKSTTSIKCVLIGDSSCGKTSLINRYIYNQFDPYSSATIGSSFFHKKVLFDDKEYNIDIWDTAGQERYRSLMPMYYRKSDLIFICFDLSQENHMEQIDRWKREIDQYHSTNIVYVGTKSDLKIHDPNFECYQTSSKMNHNVDKMFNEMIEWVCKNKKDNKSAEQFLLMNESNENKSRNCNC